MSTLAQLKSRVADDINRTDLTNQIANAVADAIYDYQSRRFLFNQIRDDFATVQGQEFYDDTDFPTDIIEIDALKATVNGRDYPLIKKNYIELERIATTTSTEGNPRWWAWYAEQIRLYPIPDGAYTLTISYHKRIPVPAENESNEWTDEQNAGQLIRYAASRRMFTDFLRDSESALRMAEQESLQLRRLQREAQRLETGGLVGSM